MSRTFTSPRADPLKGGCHTQNRATGDVTCSKVWGSLESPEEHWGRRALPRKGSATVSSPRHPPVSAGRGVPRLLPLPRPKSPRMRIAPYPRKQSNNSACAVERPNRWLINSLTTRHFARERVQPLRKSYLSPGQFFLASRLQRFGPVSRSRLGCGCVGIA